jgi:phage baseplate assembly protein W
MNPFERTLRRFRRVDTRVGDTPQKLAARELGDAARWYDIVAINNLLPPWFTDDPNQASNRVILTGGAVMVPDVAGATPQAPAPDPDKTFGIDIALTDGVLTADGGDLQLVSGYRNLAQAIRHRIATRTGELLFHVTYGCGVWALFGKKPTGTTAALAAALTKRAVASDPRVADARGVVAEIIGDTLSVTGTAVAADGSTFAIENAG